MEAITHPYHGMVLLCQDVLSTTGYSTYCFCCIPANVGVFEKIEELIDQYSSRCMILNGQCLCYLNDDIRHR